MVTRKIGKNRNVARLWLEGNILAKAGWNKGDRFDALFSPLGVVYQKDDNGKRKVAGTADRPIIDTNTNKLLEVAQIGEVVSVNIGNHKIKITK